MPSTTITTSTENWTRVKAALNAQFDWDEDESLTDLQKYRRWLKGQHTELVYKTERNVAQGAIAPDNDIADVT